MKPVFTPGSRRITVGSDSIQSTYTLEEFKTHFQPHLDGFIDRKTQTYTNYIQDKQLVSIWNYPRKLAARGKRIRPYVAYLMYSALSDEGGERYDGEENVLPILVSLELFHLFCLVHDDIIDRGNERHTLPTIQRLVAAEMEVGNGLHDRMHIGNSQALLLGDVLFAWAQECFHGNRDFDASTQRAAQIYFNLMIDEVVLGEMLDVDMMTRLQTSQSSIEKKMLLKTASYTFVRPMQMGAALAGTGRTHEKYCSDLGYSLGVAFQIQDDLLDLVGTPETTHKTLFADLRDHQHTHFTQFIFDRGSKQERLQLQQLLGTDLKLSDRDAILNLFECSGALEYGRHLISFHLEQARSLVENAPFGNSKGEFRQLIDTVRNRVPESIREFTLQREMVA